MCKECYSLFFLVFLWSYVKLWLTITFMSEMIAIVHMTVRIRGCRPHFNRLYKRNYLYTCSWMYIVFWTLSMTAVPVEICYFWKDLLLPARFFCCCLMIWFHFDCETNEFWDNVQGSALRNIKCNFSKNKQF